MGIAEIVRSLYEGGESQEVTETMEVTYDTGYSDNELLFQINENVVHGTAVFAALIGICIGFAAAKELLRIWLK